MIPGTYFKTAYFKKMNNGKYFIYRLSIDIDDGTTNLELTEFRITFYDSCLGSIIVPKTFDPIIVSIGSPYNLTFTDFEDTLSDGDIIDCGLKSYELVEDYGFASIT